MEEHENVIEWLTGQDTIAVTFSQLKWVNRIKRLAENPTNNITILRENPDGSIFCPPAYLLPENQSKNY